MNHATPSPSARTATRTATRTTKQRPASPASRILTIGLFVLVVATAVAVSQQVIGPTSSGTITTPLDKFFGDDSDALGREGGVVPEGVTAFDDDYPAVANLAPALLRALRAATSDAAVLGVDLFVNSGWRSEAYQDQLLDDAVDEYGSREEAARWVATPETSAHVSGDAVDIGEADAAEWLARHGAAYGLCRTYRNEPWHFELRPGATGGSCPRPYADPTEDPRMQQ